MSTGGRQMFAVIEAHDFELMAVKQELRNTGIPGTVVVPASCALSNNRADYLVDHAGVSKQERATASVLIPEAAHDSQNAAAKLSIGFTAWPTKVRVILCAIAPPDVGILRLDSGEREPIEPAAVDLSQCAQDSPWQVLRRRRRRTQRPAEWAGVDRFD